MLLKQPLFILKINTFLQLATYFGDTLYVIVYYYFRICYSGGIWTCRTSYPLSKRDKSKKAA